MVLQNTSFTLILFHLLNELYGCLNNKHGEKVASLKVVLTCSVLFQYFMLGLQQLVFKKALYFIDISTFLNICPESLPKVRKIKRFECVYLSIYFKMWNRNNPRGQYQLIEYIVIRTHDDLYHDRRFLSSPNPAFSFICHIYA